MSKPLLGVERSLFWFLNHYPRGLTIQEIVEELGGKEYTEAELRAAAGQLLLEKQLKLENDKLMLFNKFYRIFSSRDDVPESQVNSFWADPANEDEEAKKKFVELKKKRAYSWDYLRMERVEIAELVIHISSSNPNDRKEQGAD